MAKEKEYIGYFDVLYEDLCEGRVDFPEGVTKVKIIGNGGNFFSLEESSLPETVKELAIEGFHFSSFDGAMLPRGLVALDFTHTLLAPLTQDDVFPVGAINLSMCTNLETLILRNCGLTSMNVIAAPPQLIELNVNTNPGLEFLDLTGFDGLKDLNASHCKLKEASPGGESLEKLNLSFNNLESLRGFDFSGYENLQELILLGNDIRDLDFAKAPPSLEKLMVGLC